MMKVLENSLYPGARADSIKLVLGYCKAAGLDPMQKPVHIVPISVKQGDQYVMRDTVMPGIGLYRTQASRTGEYAGITEPEFGPAKQLTVGSVTVEYPEWCRVTVKRRVGGSVVGFTANERWLENYATAKRDTIMPNAMWKRRPYAQLAKCAEAQALRKAFPELGAAPTADEMDGKTLDEDFHGNTIDGRTGTVEGPQSRSAPAPQPTAATAGTEQTGGAPAGEESPLLSEGERNFLKKKMEAATLGEPDLIAKFGKGLAELRTSEFAAVKTWIANPAG